MTDNPKTYAEYIDKAHANLKPKQHPYGGNVFMTDTSHQMNQDRANLPERVELARRLKRAASDAHTADYDQFIILVYLPWNRVTPFVTWSEYNGSTTNGGYFSDLRAALEDYETR